MRPHATMVLSLATALLVTAQAHAFCGFYVEGSGANLQNRASSVVLMRDGTRTVLTMQNNYEGPPQNFALVVPVPTVLQRSNVRVLRRDVFDRVERMAAPRLVEYWEQDPCAGNIGVGNIGGMGYGAGAGSAATERSGSAAAPAVRVEARFDVGEYDVVILSATDSAALETWLRTERYHIPSGASAALAPYVRAGMKFFVARVNASRVNFQGTRAVLSPLRVHYDSDSFSLPVRLGLINSPGRQELIVHILANNQRYNVANRPNIGIPTNLELREEARANFAVFYNALFDRLQETNPGSVVTEYAWQAQGCDPCPGPILDQSDLFTLGADVLPMFANREEAAPAATTNTILRPVSVQASGGGLGNDAIRRVALRNMAQLTICWQRTLANNPSLSARPLLNVAIGGDGITVTANVSGVTDPALSGCLSTVARRWQYPATQDGSTVTARIQLVPVTMNASRFGGGFGMGMWSPLQNFVLTRLHLRYGSELTDDLVFRAVGPIMGGRETTDSHGQLSTDAERSDVNNFQARYIIRHRWQGPIRCPNPTRGVWGGPPSGGNGVTPARDLAFAGRGNASTLQTLVRSTLPRTLQPSATPPATQPRTPPRTTENSSAPPRRTSWIAFSGVVAAAFSLYRRRRPS